MHIFKQLLVPSLVFGSLLLLIGIMFLNDVTDDPSLRTYVYTDSIGRESVVTFSLDTFYYDMTEYSITNSKKYKLDGDKIMYEFKEGEPYQYFGTFNNYEIIDEENGFVYVDKTGKFLFIGSIVSIIFGGGLLILGVVSIFLSREKYFNQGVKTQNKNSLIHKGERL